MMEYFETFALYAMILSNAVLLAAAAIALLRFQRRLRHDLKVPENPDGAANRESQGAGSDSGAVLSGFLERRLAIMHQRLNELSRQLDEAPAAASPTVQADSHFFSHAVRMARNGAGVDDLVRVCGLSPTEARLIHRLHGRRVASG